jgi:AraC-like DNA-binding protein
MGLRRPRRRIGTGPIRAFFVPSGKEGTASHAYLRVVSSDAAARLREQDTFRFRLKDRGGFCDFVAAPRSSPQGAHCKLGIPRPILRRVLDRMHAQFDTKLSLSALAAESGCSRSQFMRMFKAAMGVAPHRHLVELRLRHAQQLIASRNSPLIDIAFECGFRSHAHFSTAFTRRFGMTPSLYRKSLIAGSF